MMAAMKIRSVKYNFLMNFLLTGSNILFPLITFPIASRALLADGYGLCQFATSTASWFSLIAMLGVNRYGIREVARVRENAQALSKVTREILLVTVISTVIVYAAFIASIFLVERFNANRMLFFINGFAVILNTLGVNWFFQGIEQYTYITIRGLFIKIACFAGVFFLVKVPDDYLIYAVLYVGATGLANLINFFYMFKILNDSLKEDGNRFQIDGTEGDAGDSDSVEQALAYAGYNLKRHIRPLLRFFVIAGAISIYTVLDTVMLGLLSTDTQVGFYSSAAQVKTALSSVVSALTGVLLPRASNLLSKGQNDKFKHIVRVSIRYVLLFSIPACGLCAALATPLITWYAGDSFAGAGLPLTLLAIAVIPIGLSIIFCDEVMVPLGLERYCMWIYIAAAAVNFGMNLFTIPLWGAVGAAISNLTVEVLITAVEFFIIRKYIWGGRL